MTLFVSFNIIWPGIKFVGNQGCQLCFLCFCIPSVVFCNQFFHLSFFQFNVVLDGILLLNTIGEIQSSQFLENIVNHTGSFKRIQKSLRDTFHQQSLHPAPLCSLPPGGRAVNCQPFISLLATGWNVLVKHACLQAIESAQHSENTGKMRGK